LQRFEANFQSLVSVHVSCGMNFGLSWKILVSRLHNFQTHVDASHEVMRLATQLAGPGKSM